jgi:hypothetical protein
MTLPAIIGNLRPLSDDLKQCTVVQCNPDEVNILRSQKIILYISLPCNTYSLREDLSKF